MVVCGVLRWSAVFRHTAATMLLHIREYSRDRLMPRPVTGSRVTGQLNDGSRGLRVIKCDQLSALMLKWSTRIVDPAPNFRMRRLEYCD